MSKFLLQTIIFVPVLLGVIAARCRRPRRGLRRLLISVLVFDAWYALFLYYFYLRLV